jgi:hypothetical protein
VVDIAAIRSINRRLKFAQQKFLSCRCILADWAEEESQDFCSDRELRNLRKLLPVSVNKIRVAVIEKRAEGFVVQVCDDSFSCSLTPAL